MTPMTLVEAALRVLETADPFEKARMGEAFAIRWLSGDISLPYSPDDSPQLAVPDRPARLDCVKLLPSHLMPKLGKAGSLQSRQAIVHSLVHTESWAIDLSWDIIARFGKQESMPREFFTDFVKVAQDEARHFTLLAARLQQLGSFYGAFPAHDGLWDSAIKTSDALLARLAIEHCVHEARGLDVLPTTISRFRNGGDECTATLLETIVYPEEITHCAVGVKWFRYLCLRTAGVYVKPSPNTFLVGSENSSAIEGNIISREAETENADGSKTIALQGKTLRSIEEIGSSMNCIIVQTFHDTVRSYFRGSLKPPFNKLARDDAGFDVEWYEPLATKAMRKS